MGSALLTGWLAGGLDPDAVVVVEPFADTQAALREAHPGLQVVDSADDISVAPSVIILAVKPQVMAEAMESIAGAVKNNKAVAFIEPTKALK